MSADMLVFEMPDFLGENVDKRKGNVSLDKDDHCLHTDHWMTVGLSCNEYVCYTVHYMEKLKQRVFLKNWSIVDITFWKAYRYTSLCQKARKQKTPNCNHFDVGKKSCAGVGLNFQIKKIPPL